MLTLLQVRDRVTDLGLDSKSSTWEFCRRLGLEDPREIGIRKVSLLVKAFFWWNSIIKSILRSSHMPGMLGFGNLAASRPTKET